MKREEIYIEVTPETVGAYVAVLEKHNEKMDDMSVTGSCRVIKYMYQEEWFVGVSSDSHDTLNWTPEQLDNFLTELKEPPAEEIYVKDSKGNWQQVTVLKGHTAVKFSNGVVGYVANEDLFTIKPFKP